MTILRIESFDWTTDRDDLIRKGMYSSNWSMNNVIASGRFGDGNHLQTTYTSTGMNLPAGDYDTICIGLAMLIGNFSAKQIHLQDGNGVTQVSLQIGSDGQIDAYGGTSSLLASSSVGVVNPYAWFFVELKVYVHDSAGTVEVRANGVEVINETGQDTKYGTDYIGRLLWSAEPGVQSVYCDDIYITDGEFLGDCRIRTFFPTSDETYSQFTPSEGSDNYAMVDDTNPDDDSTYIESATLNAKDSYGVTPVLPGVVKALQVTSMTKKTGTSKVITKNLIRSGGSDYNSTEEKSASASYECLLSIHEVDPDDSNPWTLSKVQNAEFGLQITAITTTTTTTSTTTTTMTTTTTS